MIAIIWMAAAILLLHLAPTRWTPTAVAICACIAGTTLPDIDHPLPFVPHRSGLTHGVLPVAVALARRRWWPIAAGLGIGVGLHLAADCFPNAMRGYAMVRLPFAGSIGREASYAWLAVNAALATAAGAVALAACFRRRVALLLLAGMAAIGVAYLLVTDGGWPALAVYGAGGWLAVRSRNAGRGVR